MRRLHLALPIGPGLVLCLVMFSALPRAMLPVVVPADTPVPATPTLIPPTAMLSPVSPTATVVSPTLTASPMPLSPTPASPTLTPSPVFATPTATSVPPTPTVTVAQNQIVVEAFSDVTGPGGLECPGCDKIFSAFDQAANARDPLPNLTFVLRDAASGQEIARQTTTLDPQGRARTTFWVPADSRAVYVLEPATTPPGFELCPNVSRQHTIQPRDFVLGTRLEQFPFWRGCKLEQPTMSPTPMPQATATPELVLPTPTSPPPPPEGPAPAARPTSVPELPITGGSATPAWVWMVIVAAVFIILGLVWRWVGNRARPLSVSDDGYQASGRNKST